MLNHDKRLIGMVSIGDFTRASSEFAGEPLPKLSVGGDYPGRHRPFGGHIVPKGAL